MFEAKQKKNNKQTNPPPQKNGRKKKQTHRYPLPGFAIYFLELFDINTEKSVSFEFIAIYPSWMGLYV